ncbi:hypothetical protein EPB42_15505, partial [Listeria monocytogenes]|nr:hypothetical protein [Listeria monocytogenes]
MSRIVIVDIDNCIANVNKALKDKGYRTDIYPSPVPSRLFDDGSIFKNAEPMKSVIENIEGIIDDKKDMCMFLTSRPNKKHISSEITRQWINEHTPFTFPFYFTDGVPKGEVIRKVFSDKAIREYEWIIFDDSPHEIISYLNLKNDINVDMEIYIPAWEYNSHID